MKKSIYDMKTPEEVRAHLDSIKEITWNGQPLTDDDLRLFIEFMQKLKDKQKLQ